jgi:hypothetical protein
MPLECFMGCDKGLWETTLLMLVCS